MTKFHLPDLKGLPFGGAGNVQDPDLLEHLDRLPTMLRQWTSDPDLNQIFLDSYSEWIRGSQSVTWQGLDRFQHKVYCNATTEAFDKFYMKNNQRRFRCFRGEYMYHQLAWRNCWPNWLFLDDDALAPGDAVVISTPFADTGNIHPRYQEILEQADNLDIPVLVDCAYFGICYDLEIDLSHRCITDVTFSLSKTFPLSHARIGMRLTLVDDDDPLCVVNKTNYTNRIGAGLGLEFIKNYSADYISDRYKTTQHLFCEQLGAIPSHCVIFGLGDQKWQQYNRGAGTNRLALFRYLASRQLPDLS